ncbi:hypothetical protein RB195_017299 [Necator americanus]|uniref:Acyltransferase 3 domain-containing protein n=1 Tax=Necator americanus TaxID=51031 RepID=A0ABR1C5L3_NECAM
MGQMIPQDYVLAMVPIILWMSVVVYGTVNSRSVLSSLSLRRSFKELTMERHSQLDVLDVFRVVAIIWVMINHTGSEGRVDNLDRLPSAEKFKCGRRYTKCGPFLLGLLLGTATTKMRPSLDRRMSRLIATLFFVLCVCVIYAILPQYWYGDHLTRYNLYYTATFRTVFSIGVCGMILAIVSRFER